MRAGDTATSTNLLRRKSVGKRKFPVQLAQELFLLRPILGKAAFGNDHLVIVGQRPESVVEEPVRILAQGEEIVS